MNMEARVGMVVEGAERVLSTAHGSSVVESSARRYLQPYFHSHSQTKTDIQSPVCPCRHSATASSCWHVSLGVPTIDKLEIEGRDFHTNLYAVRSICSGGKEPVLSARPLLHTLLGGNLQGGGNLFVHFVGGGMAGITAASATYPLDLVRTRLAAQRSTIYYRGIWHAFHTICRDEGFWGLYKGLGATFLGVGPSIAISFSVYETLRSFWQSPRPNDSTVMVSLACGSLSGIVSSTAKFPLDLVRRRMQLEGVGGQARIYNTGLFGTFGRIVQTEGLRGLYREILPECYKVVPSVGIVFMTYETLKMLVSRTSYKD